MLVYGRVYTRLLCSWAPNCHFLRLLRRVRLNLNTCASLASMAEKLVEQKTRQVLMASMVEASANEAETPKKEQGLRAKVLKMKGAP